MTLYIILIFSAICVGMAISVKAFGTGGKRKRIFQDIYFSIEEVDGIGVLYTKTGEYSAVLKMENPVQKYSANIEAYYEFTHLFAALAQTLGEGYALHKQDVFVRKAFKEENGGNHEFLSESYFRYFNGRPFTDSVCYLTITQENKKSRLMSFDNKKWRDFLVKIRKVHDQLRDAGVKSRFLGKTEACEYVDRFFSMNFRDKVVSMTNFKVDDETIGMGDRSCKVYSLVDVDYANLPSVIRPYANIEVNNTSMPVDLVSIVDSVPGADCVVFNQMVFVPNQKRELALLDKKKNRHASMPNPSNLMAVEDIKRVQEAIARESKQLVYTHYNLVVAVSGDTDIQKCTNHLENSFSRMGIHISKRAYNQLELFVNSFPGNCYGMNADYDRFLTLGDAATCLMYKERIVHNEDTPLKIYYTDRQGVPVAIDITGKEGKEKLTDNSNFFCLGPSGSGKSFHMNSVVRQLWEQNTDIVMVDTGNSYEGLCEYVGGKYIAYTEDKPITMNPFNISKRELNIEKIDFLKNLILLIWKGSETQIPELEFRVVEQLVTEYYDFYFNGVQPYPSSQKETLRKNLSTMEKRRGTELTQIHDKVEKLIKGLEERRMALSVKTLSFDSFYEFACERLDQICIENNITTIDCDNFAYMLQNFYRGGKYDKILNENVDSTLFDETFIVFEVDAIKENKQLFPIVTLIIMDVFLQKMRLKKNRKCLVIEEAWKAIASPLMAEYIKYLYKTARKFWASVGVVTQEIQDIIGSPIVKEAIINNSDVVMLLDQSKFRERFDEIKAILGLTDVDCKKIFTVNRLDNKEGRSFFREVFIRRGSTSGVYGVEEPHECYMTYTTERAEKEALKLYKHELKCRHQEAIERYCRDWDASGIGKSLAFAQKVNEAGHVLNLTDDGATRR
ncbi:TraG family conjugative transposon ATPase [Bacteroides fragilis]|uniref:TraG family conjugative transposon ATPase n=1 Tax=Bacteroides fragilis TaxID=817 RepID=UPI0004520643|nr:TraG family conjugative transposon ATPase [Bacteroides fragilis]EXY85512.1 conjugation system ATPase, TraG family protein [Bacteroides fragilis str. 3996 N(B) 6]